MKKTTKRVSMGKRLTLSIVLGITIISILAGSSFYHYNATEITKSFNKKVEQTLSYLEGALAPALWNFDNETARYVAQTILQEGMVSGISIHNESGETVFSQDKQNNKNRLIRKRTIRYQEKTVGQIVISFTNFPLDNTLDNILSLSLFVWLLMVTGIAILTNILVRIFFRAPLDSFIHLARSYRENQNITEQTITPYNEFEPIEEVVRNLANNAYNQLRELRISESRYKNLFNNAEISLWNEDLSEVYEALERLRTDGVTDLRQYIGDRPEFARDATTMVRVNNINVATLKLFNVKDKIEFLDQIDKSFGPGAIDVFIDELCAIWSGKSVFRSEAVFISADGHEISAIISFHIPDSPEGFKSIPVSIIDITERKQTEKELNKLSRAVEYSSSAVIITDINGYIEYVNPKFTEITGYTRNEVIGKNPRMLSSHVTEKASYDDLWATITSGKEWRGEFYNQKKDGNQYWARASVSGVRDDQGNITHYISIQDDMTREYEMAEQLSYQASHDALTGLVNRREFENRAERLLATIQQDKDKHAFCFMDLDQFKVVNDTYGHTAGDDLLRKLSVILQHEVRRHDTLARLGGDEFGVLMVQCSLKQARRVATSLQKAIQEYQFMWEGHSFKVGVSIGLVAITENTPDLSELMKQADSACYMAKDMGRNRIHEYQTEDEKLVKRHGEMLWVTRIQEALDKDSFCLHSQVIVALDGHNDRHYELLIRMVDKKGEIISPNAFLPAAERYSLIGDIDRWVIENTFTLLASNTAFVEQISFISINLSGQTLADSEMLETIINQLDKNGIDGDKVCFEITETTAISNLSYAKIFISTLKKLGCKFALDDFGSGLSSYGYLKDLPVDYLKIDGTFIKNIVDNPIDYAMVKSINEIGHVMGMQTIAEFVENDDIKNYLVDLGVNYAQGYGIGKPVPFSELLEWSSHSPDDTPNPQNKDLQMPPG